MFYWYTSAKEGPHFTPEFLGHLECIGYFSMIVGITIYNRYLSNVSYRKIFTVSQVVSNVCSACLGRGPIDSSGELLSSASSMFAMLSKLDYLIWSKQLCCCRNWSNQGMNYIKID